MSSEDIQGPLRWKVKKRDGSRLEPASLDVLRHWVTSGQIEPDDLVINEDLADWVLAPEIVELADLFRKHRPERLSEPIPAEKASPEPSDIEQEVQAPDCAFHPGRTASEICVGCGKFICEECRRRVERKVYCRRCLAEKQAGVEPGAPVGPEAPAMAVPGGEPQVKTSRLAISSVVFLAGAVLASVAMFVPGPNLMVAPAAGFIAFVAAMLGGIALSRIRQSGGSLRGKGLALSGLVTGCVVLTGTLVVVFIFITKGGVVAGRDHRRSDAPIGTMSGRRPGTLPPIGRRRQVQNLREREVGARQLLDEVGALLNEGRLEEAIGKCKEIVQSFPNTRTAGLVNDRLPVLLEELERRRAEAEAQKLQNEQAAQNRYEHAVKMFADGDEATALELLRSVVEGFPETESAKKAGAMIASNEKRMAAENLRKLEGEARELVAQAERLIETERYGEALQLYRRVVDEYSLTTIFADAETGLDRAEKLVSDPSEREFHRIQKSLDTKTYEESIELLGSFLGKYPTSARIAEASDLLDENTRRKRTADNLYNFGRAYLDDGKYEIALGRYNKLIKDYSRSRWVPQARKEYEEAFENLSE